ncbi:hypothetical protein CAXC1_200002 [Candidatus Xenohaliotis californiensis]|uniref:Uncharacterized protein n=1 Tax=Candidatus Xenohaliotis californiensis TaxID=84677 RepID=A0ABP0EVI3_9RICK|nr:hypothetical protein CAXC1_200002 [Candidatus Xenohaliotis californiensis]
MKKTKNKFWYILIIFFAFCTTIAISQLLKYAPTNISIALKNKNLAIETKQPINHKYSCWLGNGDALKEYIPLLLAQAKGLGGKNITNHLVVDYKVYDFLKNAELQTTDHENISKIMMEFDLEAPKAKTYIDYCNKTNLQIVLDSDIFNKFKQEIAEPYTHSLHLIYKTHLHNAYRNKKDYAYAADLLRQVAMQTIGKKNEVLLYTDADIVIDHRMMHNKVEVREDIIKVMPLFYSYPLAHSIINHKTLRKINTMGLKRFFILNNDVLLGKAKAPWLKSMFYQIDKMYYMQRNIIAQYCSENNNKQSCEMTPISIWDIHFNASDEMCDNSFILIKKEDIEKLKEVMPNYLDKRVFQENKRSFVRKMNAAKNKANSDEFNKYQTIQNTLLSDNYLIVYKSQIFQIAAAATTVSGIITNGVNTLMQIANGENVAHYNKAKIIKMLTIDPMKIGIISRQDKRTWEKHSEWLESSEQLLTITESSKLNKYIKQAIEVQGNTDMPYYWQRLFANIMLPIF